jgi:hypothetical protein
LGGGRVNERRRSISLLEMHSGADCLRRVVRIVARGDGLGPGLGVPVGSQGQLRGSASPRRDGNCEHGRSSAAVPTSGAPLASGVMWKALPVPVTGRVRPRGGRDALPREANLLDGKAEATAPAFALA